MTKFTFCLLSCCLLLVNASAGKDLFPAGNFENAREGTLPTGWSGHLSPHLNRIDGSHSIVRQGDDVFLRLSKGKPESTLRVISEVPLPEGAKTIILTLDNRVVALQQGSQNPNRDTMRVSVGFLDSHNEIIRDATPQIAHHRARNIWEIQTQDYEVPQGAVALRIGLTLLNCSGIWDIRSLQVTAMP
jgi:hypothetical protein